MGCNLPAKGRSIEIFPIPNMVVGVADEAQSTFIRSSAAREILHVPRKPVERIFHVVDVEVPGFEHLSIGEVRPSNKFLVLPVYCGARLLWKLGLQVLEFSRSTLGQILHDVESDHDFFAVFLVGTRFVPVEVPVVGLLRTDTREYPGSFNAGTSDLICVWILFARVRELLSVVSGREQDGRGAIRWRNCQCGTGSGECNQQSDGLHFGLEMGFNDAMSVLLLPNSRSVSWATATMYTQSLNRLRLNSQCVRAIFSIAQLESNVRNSRYSSADVRRPSTTAALRC
jgi:hypothetical protein